MSANNFSESSTNLKSLLKNYDKLNEDLETSLKTITDNSSSETNPGQFLQLQMRTSSLAQIGESISNIIANANSVIKNAVQSQRAGA